MEVRHRTFPISVQPGIPKLSALKPGWRRFKIGELLREVRRPVEMDDERNYRLLTVKRSRGGVVERNTLLGSQIAVKSQFLVEEGDFLISKRQIVHGACAVVPADLSGSIVSNEYSVLRCQPDLDIGFLKYLSFSIYFQQTCFHSSIGVHVEKLIFKLEDWFNWEIDIPTLSEQNEISTFLGAVDDRLAGLGKKHDLLASYKRGIMQGVFSQKIRFKRDDGSDFPSWKELRLGDVFTERNERGQSNAALLSVTLKQGVVDASKVERANSASTDRSNYKSVQIDDLAYNSMRMWQGASGVSKLNGIVSPAYTVAIPRSNQVPNFWGHRFKFEESLRLFQRYSQGLTSDTWNLKFPALADIKMNVPHADEQQKIAEFLSALDNKIEAVAKQITLTEVFKKGLLQKMFARG